MDYQLASSGLRAIFDSAYRDYKTQTGVTLAARPFVRQLDDLDSAKSITALLQGHVPVSRDSLQNDKMMASIESIVYDICMLSTTVALGDAIGLVRQALLRTSDIIVILILQPLLPGTALLTGLATLLTVCSSLLPSRAWL